MPDTDFSTALERVASVRTHRGELANKLEKLRERYSEPWEVFKQAHDYKDGTTHFNHVRYTHEFKGEKMTVEVAQYLTPELAELLCLLHNNLDEIIPALRGKLR